MIYALGLRYWQTQMARTMPDCPKQMCLCVRGRVEPESMLLPREKGRSGDGGGDSGVGSDFVIMVLVVCAVECVYV